MAYEYLEKYFGQDSEGTPGKLTFEELSAALGNDKEIKLYNLSDGGYVGKEKLDSKIAELASVKAQLEEANSKIKSYKDMDIEGIKGSAEEWEKRYKEETAALSKQLADQEYEYRVKELESGLRFSSASAKKAFHTELMAERLTVKDGDVIGFDDFVKAFAKGDPDAFVKEEPEKPAEPKPRFSEQKTQTPKKKLTLSEMMDLANSGKDVSSLF